MATDRCIFCGSNDISAEDVIPKWVRPIIDATKPPPSAPGKIVVGEHRRWSEGDVKDVDDFWINRKGMGKWTARCVCGRCNNEWMSDIEQAVIPVLTQMIRNQPVVLDVQSREALARWLALKAVLSQYLVTPKRASTDWNEAFWKERRPPASWHIRVGQYTGNIPVTIGKAAITFEVAHRLSPVTFQRPGLFFSISLGAFFGQVLAISQDNAPVPINRRYFIQIWPHPLLRVQSPALSDFGDQSWPPESGLDESQRKKCSKNTAEPRE